MLKRRCGINSNETSLPNRPNDTAIDIQNNSTDNTKWKTIAKQYEHINNCG